MARLTAILAIALLLGGMWYVFKANTDRGSIETKYHYLLVEVIGPDDWVKKHEFSLRWQGKNVPLPVVFRLADPGEKLAGSASEISGYLIDRKSVV